MGNEQSVSGTVGASPSTSSSSFSFLANRGSSVKKSKGIVVVRDGSIKQEDPQDDLDYKRLAEIPRFMPILRSGANGRQTSVDSHQRMSHRPIWKLAAQMQEHLQQCAQNVSNEQLRLNQGVKAIDVATASLSSKLIERRKRYDRFKTSLSQVKEMQNEIMRIQLLLEEIVPCVETLNELLSPVEKLRPLNLARVLQRTPVSSTPSTQPGSSVSSATTSPRRHIEPIEETRVLDKY